MRRPGLREARAGDAQEIVRLGEYMYATVGATVDDDWRRLAKQQIEARLGIGLFGWVAQADAEAGTLAACAFANLNARLPLPGARGPWRAYVQWVSVDPAAQRQGWASALMVEVERWAKERHVDVLELHSSPAGRALYQGLGFEASPDVVYPEDVRGVPMRKLLRSESVH